MRLHTYIHLLAGKTATAPTARVRTRMNNGTYNNYHARMFSPRENTCEFLYAQLKGKKKL